MKPLVIARNPGASSRAAKHREHLWIWRSGKSKSARRGDFDGFYGLVPMVDSTSLA
jgi:hypothetical protein